ncbi:MAG: hypothetical protein ACK4UU_03710, partial [Fimbriimonadales bacterium]
MKGLMQERIYKYKNLLFLGLVVVGLIIAGGVIWQTSRSKPSPSALEAVWKRFDGPRVRSTDQAAVDFSVVQKVMKHYSCNEFEEFFKYYRIMYTSNHKLISSAKRGIQRGRARLSDIDCSTEVLVLGYSEPSLRWARFMGIMLLSDKDSYQLARLHDTYGDTITEAERALWEKIAFIEVRVGRYLLLTIWYHDGDRLWLLDFMDAEEVWRGSANSGYA